MTYGRNIMGYIQKRYGNERQRQKNRKDQRQAGCQLETAVTGGGENNPRDHHQQGVTKLDNVTAAPEQKLEVDFSVHLRRQAKPRHEYGDDRETGQQC